MIALLGASGRTGRETLRAAAEGGVPVTALARPGSTIEGGKGMRVVRGELADAEALDLVLAGAEAVVCAFGPRPPYREAFCAEATRAILAAMRRAGVRRIVSVTGAMVGPMRGPTSLPMRIMAATFRRSRPEVAADRAEQERLLRESGLDWTIVKPPRLTNGPRTGGMVAGPSVRVGLLSKVRRADLARFLLSEVAEPAHLRESVYVRGGAARRPPWPDRHFG